MKKLLIAICLIFTTSLLHAATCHFDSNYSLDNGTGSQAEPYNELADYTSSCNPVNLKAGSNFNETLTITASGTAGSPIVVQSYGTGARPVIDRNDLSGSTGIILSNRSYVTIKGIDIREVAYGLYANSSTNNSYGIKIDDVKISDVLVQSLRLSYINDSIIENSTFENTGNNYLVLLDNGDNCTVRKNTFKNNDYARTTMFQFLSVSNSVLEYNDFSGKAGNVTYTRVNNTSYPADNNTIRYNNIHDITTSASIVQNRCEVKDVRNLRIYGNIIHNCDYSGPAIQLYPDNGYTMYDAKVYSNSVHVDGNGIHLSTLGGGYFDNLELYNNIVVVDGGQALLYTGTMSELSSDNNIFRRTDSNTSALINLGSSEIYSMAGDDNFSDYQTTYYPKDDNSTTDDPKFNNPSNGDLCIDNSTSPAIEASKILNGYTERIEKHSSFPDDVILVDEDNETAGTIGACAGGWYFAKGNTGTGEWVKVTIETTNCGTNEVLYEGYSQWIYISDYPSKRGQTIKAVPERDNMTFTPAQYIMTAPFYQRYDFEEE